MRRPDMDSEFNSLRCHNFILLHTNSRYNYRKLQYHQSLGQFGMTNNSSVLDVDRQNKSRRRNIIQILQYENKTPPIVIGLLIDR
jgi:hypothetical protein